MYTAQEYKQRINAMLTRVPPSVRDGSYQKVAAYKDAVEKAQKAAKAPTSLAKLVEAHNTLASFYARN